MSGSPAPGIASAPARVDAAARGLFVGREEVMRRLRAAFGNALAGRGGLVLLAGETGIGKTHTATEFAAQVSGDGAAVLWGGCYQGEWAPPFGPFAEAVTTYVRQAEAAALRADLGFGAAPIARVVSAVRERLPDVPEPAALQPDEERFRLFDAVSQFLIALTVRSPIVLVLDDLHWAERGAIAMLRHVARFAAHHRLLVLGTYRDVELDPQHPLTDALGALYRETTCARILLTRLEEPDVARLVADSRVSTDQRDELTRAIYAVTNGNPFFVREVLRQCEEEGHLAYVAKDPPAATIDKVSVPESVRQVISRRVRRLPTETGRLMSVAAAFAGPFHLGVAARVAGLDEALALGAIDHALSTQLVRSFDSAERYDFTHALIRETLYGELSPAGHLRLHRQIAEAMESMYAGAPTGSGHAGVSQHAGELAQQYYRSRELPGADRGVPHALAAAQRAEAAYARDEAATFLRMALALLPPGDRRRPRLLGRLGSVLAWAFSFDDALQVAHQAAQLIAAAEGDDAAAGYLAELLTPMWDGGFFRGAFALAQRGLEYAGQRRDATYASLMAMEIIRREAEAPAGSGVRFDTAERREVSRIFQLESESRGDLDATVPMHARPFLFSPSREDRGAQGWPWDLGEYRRGAVIDRKHALECEERGQIAAAAYHWSNVFRFQIALGNFVLAGEARQRSAALAARLPTLPVSAGHLAAGDDEWCMALDEGWDAPATVTMPDPESMAVLAWFGPAMLSAMARREARKGRSEGALGYLAPMLSALEDPPAWALGAGYVKIACDAAETLWMTGRIDHIEVIERNMRQKVIARDVHHPMADGRLALGRLSALQHRCDEAVEWFAKARTVLEEQGARPLRAIVDYDEALMYVRGGGPGDRERVQPLLEAALSQFRAVGMPGWIRRAGHLLATGEEWSLIAASDAQSSDGGGQVEPRRKAASATVALLAQRPPPDENIFRRDGDYWTIGSGDDLVRVKDSKGLQYLCLLLRHPGQDFLALDLVVRSRGAEVPVENGLPIRDGALNALDAQSKGAYKLRLDDLRETMREAEALNDLGQAERARAEIQFIEDELAAAIGLGGRDRNSGSNAERARSTVTKGLKSAIEKIRAVHPSVGRHLSHAVRTGVFCAYTPEPEDHTGWTF